MKRAFTFLVVLSITAPAGAAAVSDDRIDALPEIYREWIEEVVVYIITDVEKEIFLELETLEERDRFIEAFWARRDPDRATLENEFRTEHYRRLDFANTVLSRDAPRPGWRTDRGRYYIMLGEPAEIQRYDGYSEVVGSELWIYRGDPDMGLPPRFNLLFYRENDIGEYQLYHPSTDGPQKILRAGYADQRWTTQQHQSLDVIEGISLDLARAILTVDLTENTGYDMLSFRNSVQPLEQQLRPALNVDRTLANIEVSPFRRVDVRDLEGYQQFGHKVSADYSFKFFPSRGVHAVLFGPGNDAFIHFGLEIEPSRFTLERDDRGTRYYTTVDVDLEVRDLEGRPVAYNLNQPFLQLSATQFEKASSFPFAYRDNFPLAAGDYKVSVVLKNRATKDYTAAEFDVHVPAVEPGTPFLSDLILGYGGEDALAEPELHRSFQVGSRQVYPSAEHVFAIGSTVHAFVQALEVGASQEIRFRIVDSSESVVDEARAPAVSGAVVQELTLLGLDGGYYTVRADVMSEQGEILASSSTPLVVSPRNEVGRPAFLYRHSFNVDVPGYVDVTLGNQLMALGRVTEAKARFEKAVAVDNPQLPMARWRLASIVLFDRDADRALELLTPLENDYPNEYEVVEGLGFAYYIKEDYERAKGYLEHSSTIRSPDTTALNALGDCYERLGNADKAKSFYLRSLELDASQAGVQARLEGLSDK